MTLIAFGSAKGSPGVTTAAVALAAVWPAAAVLADCDPAGGDIALRLTDPAGQPLWRDRGLVALAAHAQRQTSSLSTSSPCNASPSTSSAGEAVVVDLGRFLQTARGGLDVLVGLESAAQATAISGAWPLIGQQLRALAVQRPVLADCGRLSVDPAHPDPAGAAGQLWRQADLLVLCSHPRPDALVHLLHTLHTLDAGDASGHLDAGSAHRSGTGRVPPIAVVVIDDGSSTADAVAQVRGALQLGPGGDVGARQKAVEVVGGLAHDPTGAAGLAGTPTRRLDRCPLIRSARLLAPALADRAHAALPSPAGAGESTRADDAGLAWPVPDPQPLVGRVDPGTAGAGTADAGAADVGSADVGRAQLSPAVVADGAFR